MANGTEGKTLLEVCTLQKLDMVILPQRQDLERPEE